MFFLFAFPSLRNMQHSHNMLVFEVHHTKQQQFMRVVCVFEVFEFGNAKHRYVMHVFLFSGYSHYCIPFLHRVVATNAFGLLIVLNRCH